jgi:hypothetical protein
MASKTSSQHNGRAKRFALRFPVYYRLPDSATWMEGTTENISYTGVLFHCYSSLALKSTLELRLQITVAAECRVPAEIRGKGLVVRMEQRGVPETPVALAVAMRDCRIVRLPAMSESPVGNARETPAETDSCERKVRI